MVDFHRALDKAMQNALVLRAESDVAGGVSEITRLLTDSRVPAEVRSEAIAFRGTLWEDIGRFLDAKQDYLEAHGLTDKANYAGTHWNLASARFARTSATCLPLQDGTAKH